MSTQTISKPNVGSFADLMADAAELGKQAGLGKDTQIKFYLKIVEAAFHGKIDLDGSKHATDVDDATKLTEAYVKAQSGAVIFDAKAPNQRKAVACARTLIKGGMWSKGGNGEPLGTINNLMALRQKLRADPANSKKLDDAANTLLKYVRIQIRRDQLVPAGELQVFCLKKQPDTETMENIFTSIRAKINALIDGKAGHNTLQDASAEALMIKNACTKRLADIAVSKGSGTHKTSNGVTVANAAPVKV